MADASGWTPAQLLADVRARLMRMLDAMEDDDLSFAKRILLDLLVDLETSERRGRWT